MKKAKTLGNPFKNLSRKSVRENLSRKVVKESKNRCQPFNEILLRRKEICEANVLCAN